MMSLKEMAKRRLLRMLHVYTDDDVGGLDIKQELIDIGIKHELGEKLFALKKPEFVVSDSFEFQRFSKQPDFALAQSLFTHLTESDILLCRSDPHAGFAYTQKQMSEFGAAHGWMARYIGDWNHPRQQRMLEYSIKP